MKNMLIIAICLASFIFVIPAMADETNRASIGVNYTMSFDNLGTFGSGLGVQLHLPIPNQQLPVRFRVSYMNQAGSYINGVKWTATAWNVGCIFDWRNDSNWTPYAGLGIANVSITNAFGINTPPTTVLSPASIMGIRYAISPHLDIYGELDSVSVIQAIATGIDYKF